MNEINKDVTNTKNISNKRLLIKEIAIFCIKKSFRNGNDTLSFLYF